MSADLLKEHGTLTLIEVCERCSLTEETIVDYIQEGLVTVNGDERDLWRFSEIQLVQIQKANRLERDLRLNPAGSVLALELMEEIDRLKQQLQCLLPHEHRDQKK